ncbi:MAG: mdoG [Verrucomicrobiales bacterium]|nr:mdoG [Verrucomicrobiales bacterium]
MISRLFRPALIAVLLSGFSGAALAQTEAEGMFENVRRLAKERAAKPYAARPSTLAPFWAGLTYDDHRRITFRPGKGLWQGEHRGYQLEFFHPGWVFPKTIEFHETAPDASRTIDWNSDFFDYGELKVPEATPRPDGYAGFRLMAPVDDPASLSELAVFLGASYFRALAPGLGMGTSARGLALNPMRPQGEEFPDFIEWWVERPASGAREIRAWALLDSPSVSGAYQFRILPGRGTVMEIETELTFRKDVELIGIAPFSSMMWYSEYTQPKPQDYRPEVHDADGLLIQFSETEAAWRPLDTSKTVRHSVFSAGKFLGFGLAQRDRNFASYQDMEANFHKRPSVWVQPVGEWPEGRINLIESPAGGDGSDNVVCFWEPQTRPKPGEPLRLAYRLEWLPEIAVPGLSRVVNSRRSHHVWPEGDSRPNDELFVVDFGPAPNPADDETRPELSVEIDANAKILEQNLQRNLDTGGWRVTLSILPAEKAVAVELGCRLVREGRPLSERWTAQWKP